MEKKEISLLLIIGIATTIIGGLILSYSRHIALEVMTMLFETLHLSVDFILVPLSISLCVLIFAVISWKFWLPLSKQYDELAEHVKLPKAVDKAITVEVSPKWGLSHPYKDIIGYKRNDKFPHLYFYIRVINRTYYYFEPEEVVIGCSLDNQDIGTKKWNSKVSKQETNIEVDNLREAGDGAIRVPFTIKELYDYSGRWKLDGTVIYKLKGSAIEANTQYTRPEICIHLEYVLPEEQVMKLRKEVEKAIGDER